MMNTYPHQPDSNAATDFAALKRVLAENDLGFLVSDPRPASPATPAAVLTARSIAGTDALIDEAESRVHRLASALQCCTHGTDPATIHVLSEKYQEAVDDWERLTNIRVAHDPAYGEEGLRVIADSLHTPVRFDGRASLRVYRDDEREADERDLQIRIGAAVLEAVCEDAECGLDEMCYRAATAYVDERIDGIARALVPLLCKYGLVIASTGAPVVSEIASDQGLTTSA